jgi:hypothetical protein
MKNSIETIVTAVVYTAVILGSWVLVALASGVFVGIARKAYNWVV